MTSEIQQIKTHTKWLKSCKANSNCKLTQTERKHKIYPKTTQLERERKKEDRGKQNTKEREKERILWVEKTEFEVKVSDPFYWKEKGFENLMATIF